jgi:hypothetical protein
MPLSDNPEIQAITMKQLKLGQQPQSLEEEMALMSLSHG